jgi:rubrerythrin
MTRNDTMAELFALAISAEEAAMNFYSELSLIFSHVTPASLFWEKMTRDEVLHLRELEYIRDAFTDQQLTSPPDRSLITKARKELDRFSAKFDTKAIKTLDDAFEIAYELEYSEVNTVFQAIVSEFVSSGVRSQFVLSLLGEHVSRLEDFSRAGFDSDIRKNILARHRLQT